jgi:Fic family protein
MDDKLKRLTVKKQKLDSLKPLSPELESNLDEWLRVELTYSSNAIEGNTLSRIETAEVLTRGISAVISGKPLRDQLEAISHAKALDFIKDLATKLRSHQFITESHVLSIHKIILTGIDDAWAGRYRATEVFIRGTDIEFSRPALVPGRMKEFSRWLSGQQGIHPVRVAAEAHSKLVTIHPFIDGNGRTGRLLMNLILLLNGYPMAVIRNEERTQFLDAVYRTQKKNDPVPFFTHIETAVERSLDLYIRAGEGKHPVLQKFSTVSTGKPDKEKLKIGELAEKTGETVHTIRYWTKEGLLIVTGHTQGGYQLYDKAMIAKVLQIRKLQSEKRLTLTEIKGKLGGK